MHARRLDGAQLNFWVAKSSGLQLQQGMPQPGDQHNPAGKLWHPLTFHPGTDWTHASPYLLDEWFNLEDTLAEWFGPGWSQVPAFKSDPLKWFMRAYVSVCFGEMLEDSVSAPMV
jgi:hypothetical protein